MANRRRRRRRVLGWLGLAALGLWPAVPAVAQTTQTTATVSFTIVAAGSLQAAVSLESPFGPITYADEIQLDPAVLGLAVSDPRGISAGWAVNLLSSDFIYAGGQPDGRDLPSAGFYIVSASDPTLTAGASRGDGGPFPARLAWAAVDQTRRVLWADPGWGSGDYAQRIAVVLEIPARSQAGFYVATLTVAIVSGP